MFSIDEGAIGDAVELDDVFRGTGPFLVVGCFTPAIMTGFPDAEIANLMYG